MPRLALVLGLLVVGGCCRARRQEEPAAPAQGTVAYYAAMTPSGREAYMRAECRGLFYCEAGRTIIAGAADAAERNSLDRVREELRQDYIKAHATPDPTAAPGGGYSGPKCNDGTPARCVTKGCCSRHGGVAR